MNLAYRLHYDTSLKHSRGPEHCYLVRGSAELPEANQRHLNAVLC